MNRHKGKDKINYSAEVVVILRQRKSICMILAELEKCFFERRKKNHIRYILYLVAIEKTGPDSPV